MINDFVIIWNRIKPKPESEVAHNTIMSDQDNLNKECRGLQPLAPPCSIMCNGKKGMLPNLLCSRCLLLFHRACVPSGILFEDRRFICPVSESFIVTNHFKLLYFHLLLHLSFSLIPSVFVFCRTAYNRLIMINKLMLQWMETRE